MTSTNGGVVTPALTSLTRASAEMRVLATRKISGVAMTQELAAKTTLWEVFSATAQS